MEEINQTSQYFDFAREEQQCILELQKRYTLAEMICLSHSEIKQLTGWNDDQITSFFAKISFHFLKDRPHFFQSALSLWKDSSSKIRLSIGCPIIDEALRGGINVGITEFTGEAASGKTQFCLQLCLQVQLPKHLGGLEGSACYISTEESKSWLKRLYQLEKHFKKKHPFLSDVNLCKNIHVQSVTTMEQLLTVLQEDVPPLLKNKNTKLVIIDSIAALRFDFNSNETKERAKLLWQQANQMKLLSSAFNIPIIVINQVIDMFFDEPGKSLRKIPSLGLAWSNYINSRIILARTSTIVPLPYQHEEEEEQGTENGEENLTVKKRKLDQDNFSIITKKSSNYSSSLLLNQATVLRKLHVVMSPHLPNLVTQFIITSSGIFGYEK